jgi:DNA-binding PadR family transcriptional regulator
MKPPNHERLSRRDRRIAVVLLTDADHLTAPTIAQAAQVSSLRVFRLLDWLEVRNLITGEFETRDDEKPRRRYYRLTRDGRAWAHRTTRLLPTRSVERFIEQETKTHG